MVEYVGFELGHGKIFFLRAVGKLLQSSTPALVGDLLVI